MEFQDYYAVLGVPRTASQADIKKAFRKARPRSTTRTRTRATRRRAAVQGGQRGQRGPVRPGQAVAVRPARQGLGGLRPGRRDRRCRRCRRRPRRRPGTRSRASPGSAGPAANVRYEFRTTGRHRRVQRLLPGVLRCGASEPLAGHRSGRGRRPTGGRDVRGHPGRHGPRRRDGAAGPRPRRHARPLRHGRPSRRPRPIAEITLDEAFHGTTRLVEVDGKRLEVTIPPGADTGTRIRLTGKAPGGGDLFVVVQARSRTATFTRRGADLERELPLTLEEALLGGEVHGGHAQGPRPAEDPGRHPERPDVPAQGPGHAPLQGRRPGDLLRQGQGRPADRPVRRGAKAAAERSSTSPTSPTPAHRET